MHNTLVHALGQGTQGPGPKKSAAYLAWTYQRTLEERDLQTIMHLALIFNVAIETIESVAVRKRY